MKCGARELYACIRLSLKVLLRTMRLIKIKLAGFKSFVDPTTLRFSGLIDFGDAYISHPAFDIRWPRNTDRQAILDGYQEQGQLSDAFFAVWRTVLMLTDMTSMMLSRLGRERRAQARENLVANVKVL